MQPYIWDTDKKQNLLYSQIGKHSLNQYIIKQRAST